MKSLGSGKGNGCRKRSAFPRWFRKLLFWGTLLSCLPAGARAEEPPAGAKKGLRGQFLVAASWMPDPRFQKSVILIARHDESGALGLMVNRAVGSTPLSDLLEENPSNAKESRQVQLFLGGPVEIGAGFLLHSGDVTVESSEEVVSGVFFSTDTEVLRRIEENRGPKQYRLLVGYAGWAPGQLERELNEGSWLVIEGDAASVFAEEPLQTWQKLTDRLVVRF